MAIELTVRDRCHWCRRRDAELNVTVEGRVVGCCDTCYQRGEDEIRVPLDNTEGDDDDDQD